ncbi:uncharacterized protein V3H82_023853 [Fundulus diaphanus]
MKSGKKSSSWRHSGETGGKQELKERQDAAEETPMMGDVFQPRVLLHRLVLAADVKEEAPEEQSPEGEQQESELLHIKEEQEEPGVRQEGEQLLVKEETDSSFPLTAAPINMLAADVKEEAPEEQSPEGEQQESEPLHIKEEQEEPGAHQEGEQLLVKEETDSRFPLTAAPINTSPQTDEKKLLIAISGLSRQLTQHTADMNERFTQLENSVNSRLLSIEDKMAALQSNNCAGDTNSKKRRRVHNPKLAVNICPITAS